MSNVKCQMSNVRRACARRGFSIIELIITVVILSMLGASALVLIRNQLLGTLDADAQAIKQRLLQAEAASIAGNSGIAWGVHFDNITSSAPFYALFSGAAFGGSAATTTFYMSKLVEFQAPAANASSDVIFSKLTGAVSSSATIVVRLKNDTTQTKTISVGTQGAVSVQ